MENEEGKEMIPYTYLLHHKPTDTFYYGVRWAKNCHPDEFWVKYFTRSSKMVPLLRTLFGDDSFEFEIRKVFDNSKKAVEWKYKVLRRMKVLKHPEKWLNRTDNKSIVYDVHPMSGKPNKVLAERNKIDNPMNDMKNRMFGKDNAAYGRTPWNLGLPGMKGKDHPGFGKMWINDGKHNKRIEKDEVIPDGWFVGLFVKFKYIPNQDPITGKWVKNE